MIKYYKYVNEIMLLKLQYNCWVLFQKYIQRIIKKKNDYIMKVINECKYKFNWS
jgi:hypothetical protein